MTLRSDDHEPEKWTDAWWRQREDESYDPGDLEEYEDEVD